MYRKQKEQPNWKNWVREDIPSRRYTTAPYFFSRDICIHFGANLGVEIFVLKQADFINIIFSEKAMLGRYKTSFFAIYIGVAPSF